MKKSHLTIFVSMLIASACSGPSKGIITNELTPPAYPLITIDPYTSAWSMTDNLYDESVKHWTGSEFPLLGVIKVDGTPYRFMGVEDIELKVVAPTATQGSWTGKYTTVEPSSKWTRADFDDSAWKSGEGAFGTANESTAKTEWNTQRVWVRRVVSLDEEPAGKEFYLEYGNDDQLVLWINGTQVYDSGFRVNHNRRVELSPEAVALLKKGDNLIAASCLNTGGYAFLDFGMLTTQDMPKLFANTATQTYADVQATQTHYTFTCGGIELALTFSAPLFADNLELVSRPVNYLTYEVSSLDGASHDVEIYVEASPRWALDQPYQECVSESFEDDGLVFVKSGSREQKILGKRGDDVRIDWGYFYMAGESDIYTSEIGESTVLRDDFLSGANSGGLKGENSGAKMSLTRKLGSVTSPVAGKLMIGYDDILSIQYFGNNLRPWWNRTGDKTITEQFHLANRDYNKLIDKCYRFDRELMKTATLAGGKQYAELCALAYRQVMAAHKLVEAPNGEVLWLSKENNSNGSIGTVDITYPSAPMFLYYNVELVKGMMNQIFYFSESGKWKKPFAAHDVGTYPLANGQTYGGDMPVEESGNMVILAAAIAAVEGNADYAEKHWNTLTTWTDYLVEYGLDPENQLCTDDFAGHFAHNVNLSMKAIMGIASYGRLAKMLGKNEIAEKYTAKAREMATSWIEMADDGDHYRLTFDKPGTWSQKYNLVWDKLLEFDIFPPEVAQTEVAWYLTKQNRYGLPLDNREEYTKTDWIMWSATLANDNATFEQLIEPVWRFENETEDRVPMSDWIWTDKAMHRGFKARSVVGGYWIKMLEKELRK
jgi:hypothetical protein